MEEIGLEGGRGLPQEAFSQFPICFCFLPWVHPVTAERGAVAPGAVRAGPRALPQFCEGPKDSGLGGCHQANKNITTSTPSFLPLVVCDLQSSADSQGRRAVPGL